MIGALLTGLVAGIVGRLLVPDMWSELHGPTSWLLSLVLGLTGALLGYLMLTVGLGIGDSDVFDFGGIVGAVIGVVILLPFVGVYARLRRRSSRHEGVEAAARLRKTTHGRSDGGRALSPLGTQPWPAEGRRILCGQASPGDRAQRKPTWLIPVSD